MKNHYKTASCIISGITLFLCTFMMHAQTVAVPDGYATQNGGTTGGGSATPVTVTTASAFKSAAGNDNPAVIIVDGRLNVGTVSIGSNKTIVGKDENSGLYGGVIQVRGDNYIFQNLIFGPSGSDVMEVSGGTRVFITKCSFHDSSDELCSIVRKADYVTVSWCKFYFDDPDSHSFANLIGNKDDATDDRGKLHVTWHHNWYAEGVRGRMPRVRFGYVHIYNNYYHSVGNGYCIGVGYECHIRVENTYFDNIDDPWDDYGGTSNGEIGWSNLKFVNCSQPTFMPNAFPVFTPPYSFTMDSVDYVKGIVTSCAGNTFDTTCVDTSSYKWYYLTTSVSGQGSVSPSSGSYPVGTTITHTATAAPGRKFDNWSGDLSGTSNPAPLTINSNVSVTANFSLDPTQIYTQTGSVFSFYPNPATTIVTLNVPEEYLCSEVQIINVIGETVLKKQINSTKENIKLNGLTNGVYFVKLVYGYEETQIIKKLIIQRD